MQFKKITNDFSFTTWYYTLKNEHLLEYDIFSYWSEQGALEGLLNKLPLSDNLKIGEVFFFEFDSNEVFGTKRNLTEDFNTCYFQIIEIQHCFMQWEGEEIALYKRYELAPIYREI